MVLEVTLGHGFTTSIAPKGITLCKRLKGSTLRFSHYWFVTGIVLSLFFSVSTLSAYAQTQPSSNPDETQTSQSSNKEKNALPFQFDPSPSQLVASPQAIDGSQQEVASAGMAVVPDHVAKKSKHGEIVVAPFPISNPALGSGLVVVGGYLFPVSKNDTASPASMIGGGSFYTSNGSWVWGAGTKLYLKRDRFRIAGAYGQAQLHYDLYGIGNSAGNSGVSIPISQGGKALLMEGLIGIGKKMFLGPRYQWRDLDARSTRSNIPPSLNINPRELRSTTSSLGFHFQRDPRDSQFYPRGGSLTDVVGDFFAGTLGADFSYQSYTFAFNKYSSLSPRQVFAFRVFGCATAGHVPFYDLCLLGMHNDIRGYKAGRYRDKLMLSTQAEYRLELPKRFGLAAFFGVGEVAPNLGAFNNDNLKPGGGVGIRYTVAKKNHVNLRLDYAAGLQGGGVYMGVAEAF